MRLTVESVIYFYIFICVALLVFNLLYITRSQRTKRRRMSRVRWWERELAGLFAAGGDSGQSAGELFARLKRTEELMAFQEALGEHLPAYPQEMRALFLQNRQPLYALALAYEKKPPMDRAFFAYVIASFHPPIGTGHDMLVEILLGYMENSTVYCRENVLNALYALGSERGIEHAFELLNLRGWYHHPKLLSDGLAKYTGDKARLVQRLWQRRKQWPEFLVVATVQFASGLGEDTFSQPFLEALVQEALPMEARFALVRYFQRHVCDAAKPVLLDLMDMHTGTEQQLAIAAASALSAYPGEDTRRSLKAALSSRNWYIRRNAALSINKLGITQDDVAEIRSGGDRYALEMLEYAAGNRGLREESLPKEQERTALSV